jgi:hypothetical protein
MAVSCKPRIGASSKHRPAFGHVELSVQYPAGLSEAENAALLLGYEQQHDTADRTGDKNRI